MTITKTRIFSLIATSALAELSFLHILAYLRGGFLTISVNQFGEGLAEAIALPFLAALVLVLGWKD